MIQTYLETVTKGAKGLGITKDPVSLSLIVSNGLVKDSKLTGGKDWTLGAYVEEIGGPAARSKKTFGLFVPSDTDEGEDISVVKVII